MTIWERPAGLLRRSGVSSTFVMHAQDDDQTELTKLRDAVLAYHRALASAAKQGPPWITENETLDELYKSMLDAAGIDPAE